VFGSPISFGKANQPVQSTATVQNEMQRESVFESRFLNVLCSIPGGNRESRGSLILTKSRLVFVSEQNNDQEISLGNIASIKSKRAFYKPSIEVEWDEGVICHSLIFFQDENHQGRTESILAIPKLIQLFHLEASQ
jgi:hypothetical protein